MLDGDQFGAGHGCIRQGGGLGSAGQRRQADGPPVVDDANGFRGDRGPGVIGQLLGDCLHPSIQARR